MSFVSFKAWVQSMMCILHLQLSCCTQCHFMIIIKHVIIWPGPGPKIVFSNLHNGISQAGKMSTLYWILALNVMVCQNKPSLAKELEFLNQDVWIGQISKNPLMSGNVFQWLDISFHQWRIGLWLNSPEWLDSWEQWICISCIWLFVYKPQKRPS